MNTDPRVPYTSASDTVLRLGISFIQNPMGFVSLFLGWLGTSIGMNGGQVPTMDVIFTMLLTCMLLIGFVYFLIKTLPQVYHVFIIVALCGIFSIMTMSWCLNNEQVCKNYYVVTEAKYKVWHAAFMEFWNKVLY
jgi:hypothetical protein